MTPLVSVEWLRTHLNDPTIVVLDASLTPVGTNPSLGVHQHYLEKHIPGAVFFDIDANSDQATSLPHMLPSAKVFSENISALGVSDDMHIVVYEQSDVLAGPRAWWMFRAFGAKKVSVLDGGLAAWLGSGLPTQNNFVERQHAFFEAALERRFLKDFGDIQKILSERGQIIDARSTGRFRGTSPEPRAHLSSGHMPNSINVPFTDLTEKGRLKSPEELRGIFVSKGVDLKQPITTTCGSGVTAAVVALALEIIGAESLSLYDGSWTEYAQHPEAIIEKSS